MTTSNLYLPLTLPGETPSEQGERALDSVVGSRTQTERRAFTKSHTSVVSPGRAWFSMHPCTSAWEGYGSFIG